MYVKNFHVKNEIKYPNLKTAESTMQIKIDLSDFSLTVVFMQLSNSQVFSNTKISKSMSEVPNKSTCHFPSKSCDPCDVKKIRIPPCQ